MQSEANARTHTYTSPCPSALHCLVHCPMSTPWPALDAHFPWLAPPHTTSLLFHIPSLVLIQWDNARWDAWPGMGPSWIRREGCARHHNTAVFDSMPADHSVLGWKAGRACITVVHLVLVRGLSHWPQGVVCPTLWLGLELIKGVHDCSVSRQTAKTLFRSCSNTGSLLCGVDVLGRETRQCFVMISLFFM